MNARRIKHAAEIIAETIGWDVAEVKDGRYQPTRTSLPVFTIGDDEFCCPPMGRKPPEGFEWVRYERQDDARAQGRVLYVTAKEVA